MKVCNRIPIKYDNFPSMREVAEVIFHVKQYSGTRDYRPPVAWCSQRAPGTPAWLEAMFNIFERGDSQHNAFNIAMTCFQLSDKDFFDAYELFLEGKVLPKIEKMRIIPTKEIMQVLKKSNTDRPQSGQISLL